MRLLQNSELRMALPKKMISVRIMWVQLPRGEEPTATEIVDGRTNDRIGASARVLPHAARIEEIAIGMMTAASVETETAIGDATTVLADDMMIEIGEIATAAIPATEMRNMGAAGLPTLNVMKSLEEKGTTHVAAIEHTLNEVRTPRENGPLSERIVQSHRKSRMKRNKNKPKSDPRTKTDAGAKA